jgi:hypothetical protein
MEADPFPYNRRSMGGRLSRWSMSALVVVVALAAAGCGGESAAKRKKDFLAEATSICNHFSELQNQIQFPSGNPLAARTSHTTRAQWGLALNQIVNYGRQEVRGLRKLKAPKDLRERFQELLDTKDQAYNDLAKAADAAKRNRTAEIKPPVTAGRKKLAQGTKLARAISLPSCA